MKFPIIIVVFTTVLKVCSGTAPVPAIRFQACDVKSTNFQECYASSMQAWVKTFGNPAPTNGNTNPGTTEPFRADKVTIGPGKDQFNVRLILTDVETYGWSKSKFDNATFDLETQTSHLKGRTPYLKLKSQYEADGNILGKTFKGQGASTIIFENAVLEIKLKLEPVKKAGLDYWTLRDASVIVEPEKVQFEFQNQPKDLITEINEKWQDVFADAKGEFENALGAPLERMVHLLLDLAPINAFMLNYEL